MTKKKDLTIDEYKETLLDEIEDDEKTVEEKKEEKKHEKPEEKETSVKKTTRKRRKRKTKKEKDAIEEEIIETRKKYSLIINIVFTILVVIMVMIAIDVIAVARYNKGPFFAINTNTYKDGGTKVYHGLGYKVIKYNQIQGRRDMEIGTWSLKYSTEPTNISALDLAIEFTNKPKDTYEKYYKAFLRIDGVYKSKDEKKNTMTFGYIDEDGKYTFDIVCKIAEKDSIPNYAEGAEVTVIGTVTNYDLKEDGTDKTLYVSNCFAE